jgi:hypothetical protein
LLDVQIEHPIPVTPAIAKPLCEFSKNFVLTVSAEHRRQFQPKAK